MKFGKPNAALPCYFPFCSLLSWSIIYFNVKVESVHVVRWEASNDGHWRLEGSSGKSSGFPYSSQGCFAVEYGRWCNITVFPGIIEKGVIILENNVSQQPQTTDFAVGSRVFPPPPPNGMPKKETLPIPSIHGHFSNLYHFTNLQFFSFRLIFKMLLEKVRNIFYCLKASFIKIRYLTKFEKLLLKICRNGMLESISIFKKEPKPTHKGCTQRNI